MQRVNSTSEFLFQDTIHELERDVDWQVVVNLKINYSLKTFSLFSNTRQDFIFRDCHAFALDLCVVDLMKAAIEFAKSELTKEP